MDKDLDNVSIKSSDSVTTSGEYEIVPESPMSPASCNALDDDDDAAAAAVGGDSGNGSKLILKSTNAASPTLIIANNGDSTDLEKNLNEVIHELDARQGQDDQEEAKTPQTDVNIVYPSGSSSSSAAAPPAGAYLDLSSFPPSCSSNLSTPDISKFRQSIFYDCIDLSPAAEKQDDMKPEQSDTEEEMSEIDQDCTVFSGVTYLGAANINAPKSETEILRNMSELNSISNAIGLKVSVSIPNCPEGLVVLHDATTNAVVAHYEVHRILFYANGSVGSPDQACFAFTWSHGDSLESAIFQCHVFRCHIPEAVTQVSSCFTKAFSRVPQSLTGSITSAVDNNSIMASSITSDMTGNPISSAEYKFSVSLEIKEKVAKNSYSSVPRDRSGFKLRCNTDKEVIITVKQEQSTMLQPLHIERCFGVLLSPGKSVRQADMQLLDMATMGYMQMDGSSYQISAEWKANDKAFEQLNFESQKMDITVAVDLVIKGIQEPVRFIIETPVSIQSQSELRIMDHFLSKRSLVQQYYLQLKENGEGTWGVNSIDPSEGIVEPNNQSSILKFGINNFTKMVRSASVVSIEQDDSPTDFSSDGDEPLLSGTGEVSKDCPQDRLDEWSVILKEWDEKRPKLLAPLVRLGIPEALRGEIWQKLARVERRHDLAERYRLLITKETNCETVIQRDIHRTFPAHKFFKETANQDALYKVSKAYAVYDSEVGYCQGLSFIAASLLLHMPEEEAFCVLVSLMYEYGLRDLYKHGFESLYLRLYQLNRLMKDQLPRLYEHFNRLGIETHMFASQWFLTLFTARFPLYFVFHILDVFLLEGMPMLFQVAITLLSNCESDLNKLDFEGILKYFRVTLPKRCRSPGNARKLMKKACEKKVKRLKQYEEEFMAQKEITDREEQEAKQYELKFNDERKKLQLENTQLQEKLTQITEQANNNDKKNTGIILDYKQIIQRQEQQITKLNDMLEDVMKTVSSCANCSSTSPLHKTFGNVSQNYKSVEAPLGPLDPLNVALQRIRELELELAQTKLAQVEAECKNQDLNHQLNTTLTEIQSNRSSWQPWLSKTLNSIQEKVGTRKDVPTFQSYTNLDSNIAPIKFRENASSTASASATSMKAKLAHRNSLNRNSIDLSKGSSTDGASQQKHQILKDSMSCNNLK